MAYVAPDGSVSVPYMPGAAQGSYTLPGQVSLPSGTGSFVPVQGGIGLQGGTDATWASLGRDELNALIQYRNASLAAQAAQANAQNSLAGRQLDTQADQFDKQLFFNEQAQRFTQDFSREQLAKQADTAERARQTSELLGRYTAAGQEIGQAQDEALKRQQLALSGYTAAEQARAQQQQQALATAQLIASLRGPSNAFKQLEVNGYLNQNGAAPLLAALAGRGSVPLYQAPGGTPEAATLGTMARDAGAPMNGQYLAPSAFSDAAGIQGLLQVANQNAAYTPTDPSTGQPSATYALLLDRLARENTEATEAISGDRYGPGSSVGARIIKAGMDLVAANNGQWPPADDPRMLALYTSIGGLSTTQAKIASRYAHDYAAAYGVPMDEGQLNDMVLGQVARGVTPDPSGWRVKPPKWGQPGAPTPPIAWSPEQVNDPSHPQPGTGLPPITTTPGTVPNPIPGGTTPPGGAAPGGTTPPTGTPPGGTVPPGGTTPPVQQPPAAGGGSSLGARVLAETQKLIAAGQPVDDSHAVAIWQQQAQALGFNITPQQAAALHQASKDYYGAYQAPLNEGQLNDLFGQINAGQTADPTKWRQPPPSPGSRGGTGSSGPGGIGGVGTLPPVGQAAPAAQPTPAQPAQPAQEWVKLPDGRGAYKIGNGYYDGTGALLGTDPNNLAWTSYYGPKPAPPPTVSQPTTPPVAQQPAYVAPTITPAQPTPAAPAPASDPAYNSQVNSSTGKPYGYETFTWTGSGYIGSQGSKFDTNWAKVG